MSAFFLVNNHNFVSRYPFPICRIIISYCSSYRHILNNTTFCCIIFPSSRLYYPPFSSLSIARYLVICILSHPIYRKQPHLHERVCRIRHFRKATKKMRSTTIGEPHNPVQTVLNIFSVSCFPEIFSFSSRLLDRLHPGHLRSSILQAKMRVHVERHPDIRGPFRYWRFHLLQTITPSQVPSYSIPFFSFLPLFPSSGLAKGCPERAAPSRL